MSPNSYADKVSSSVRWLMDVNMKNENNPHSFKLKILKTRLAIFVSLFIMIILSATVFVISKRAADTKMTADTRAYAALPACPADLKNCSNAGLDESTGAYRCTWSSGNNTFEYQCCPQGKVIQGNLCVFDTNAPPNIPECEPGLSCKSGVLNGGFECRNRDSGQIGKCCPQGKIIDGETCVDPPNQDGVCCSGSSYSCKYLQDDEAACKASGCAWTCNTPTNTPPPGYGNGNGNGGQCIGIRHCETDGKIHSTDTCVADGACKYTYGNAARCRTYWGKHARGTKNEAAHASETFYPVECDPDKPGKGRPPGGLPPKKTGPPACTRVGDPDMVLPPECTQPNDPNNPGDGNVGGSTADSAVVRAAEDAKTAFGVCGKPPYFTGNTYSTIVDCLKKTIQNFKYTTTQVNAYVQRTNFYNDGSGRPPCLQCVGFVAQVLSLVHGQIAEGKACASIWNASRVINVGSVKYYPIDPTKVGPGDVAVAGDGDCVGSSGHISVVRENQGASLFKAVESNVSAYCMVTDNLVHPKENYSFYRKSE